MNQDEKLIYYSKQCLSVVKQMLRNMNMDYNSGSIERLMNFLQKYVTDILNEAVLFMENDNRANLDASDIKIALEMFNGEHERKNVSQKELVDISNKFNNKPLPAIYKTFGTSLPLNADYCLTRQNFKLKFLKEKYAQPEYHKFPLFSPINFHLPNNLKNRIAFSQNPYNMPHSLFHLTSLPENSLQKHKLAQVAMQQQKLTLKPKITNKANLENMNHDMRKEIIKRQICPEPQKLIFKPKLLLSLNTNDVAARNKQDETSPPKRKKF